jgi:hypothetical protein
MPKPKKLHLTTWQVGLESKFNALLCLWEPWHEQRRSYPATKQSFTEIAKVLEDATCAYCTRKAERFLRRELRPARRERCVSCGKTRAVSSWFATPVCWSCIDLVFDTERNDYQDFPDNRWRKSLKESKEMMAEGCNTALVLLLFKMNIEARELEAKLSDVIDVIESRLDREPSREMGESEEDQLPRGLYPLDTTSLRASTTPTRCIPG